MARIIKVKSDILCINLHARKISGELIRSAKLFTQKSVKLQPIKEGAPPLLIMITTINVVFYLFFLPDALSVLFVFLPATLVFFPS